MSINELVEQLKQLAITKDAAVREECEALQFVIKMAALNEREECAKVCETEGWRVDASWKSCADAIRARGNLIVLTPSKGE
jgi:hypothetical protein